MLKTNHEDCRGVGARRLLARHCLRLATTSGASFLKRVFTASMDVEDAVKLRDRENT